MNDHPEIPENLISLQLNDANRDRFRFVIHRGTGGVSFSLHGRINVNTTKLEFAPIDSDTVKALSAVLLSTEPGGDTLSDVARDLAVRVRRLVEEVHLLQTMVAGKEEDIAESEQEIRKLEKWKREAIMFGFPESEMIPSPRPPLPPNPHPLPAGGNRVSSPPPPSPPDPISGTRPGGGESHPPYSLRRLNVKWLFRPITPRLIDPGEMEEVNPFPPDLIAAIEENRKRGEGVLKLFDKNPDDMSRTEHEAEKAAAYLRLALSHIDRLASPLGPVVPQPKPFTLK